MLSVSKSEKPISLLKEETYSFRMESIPSHVYPIVSLVYIYCLFVAIRLEDNKFIYYQNFKDIGLGVYKIQDLFETLFPFSSVT